MRASKDDTPPVGKRVRGSLYVHRDALHHLAPAQVDLARKAIALCGSVNWNVVRIERNQVALLEYEDFDDEHFPALKRSVLVDLEHGSTQIRSFSSSDNPPILHRKELLLAADDPRRGRFAALTAELEKRSLFADNYKIGMRSSWQKRLEAAGIAIRNHRVFDLSRLERTSGEPPLRVERHRTAMVRNRLSAPFRLLVQHGLVDEQTDVFDYGCGQGDDVRALLEAGVAASGWDPHYQSGQAKHPADVVNLGYVINVIENPREREEALEEAWALCRRAMAIAVMVEGHYPIEGLRPYGDGFLTSRGTFQRFYKPMELRELIRKVLDVEPVAVAPGIVLVFREGEAEQEFHLRRRARHPASSILFRPSPRLKVIRPTERLSERLRPVLEQLWNRAAELGRQPEPEEVPDLRLTLAASNVSIARAMRWCRETFDEAQLREGASRRRDDLLVQFALGTFSRSKSFGGLPASLRRDVREFFGSFASAQSEAVKFLFSLGSDEVIGAACEAALAKSMIHQYEDGRYHFVSSTLSDLPSALRAFVGCSGILVGDTDDASLISIDVCKRSVTFYFTPNFDAKLVLFDRVSVVYLKEQDFRDFRLTAQKRLVFLKRSLYEQETTRQRARLALENNIAFAIGCADRSKIVVPYGDVADAVRKRSA